MAVETVYRPQFAEHLEKLFGSLTHEQAAIRTGISSEYLRKMRKLGLVPSESIVARIAAGMNADLHALRTAAGYASPAPLDEEKCISMVREQTVAYLVHTNRLSPEDARSALAELDAKPAQGSDDWLEPRSASGMG
jgi:hypothetical protein